MPKFEFKATELTETDVNFVSLVKRGANRIPFRITKGENDMIDLHKIGRQMFTKAEAAPKQPAIVGVVARKGADLKAIRNVLKAAGVDYGSFVKKADDDAISYTAEGAHEGVLLVKMNEDFAFVVSDLKKMFTGYDFDSKDFKAVHATNGFASSVSCALDSLRTVIANVMDDAASPSEAATEVGAAVEEFKSHVVALVGAIPEKAIKADALLLKGEYPAAGGCGDNQQTGDGLGDKANGAGKKAKKGETCSEEDEAAKKAKAAKKADSTVGEKEDEALDKQGAVDAKKADAGKNGTGAGAEAGKGTETNPKATADDAANTEVNAKPGEKTSGSDSGLPDKAKAKKDGEHLDGAKDIDAPPKGSTKRNAFDADADKDGDDDTVMNGESAAGEGAALPMNDSADAQRRATADDAANTPSTQGQPGGATLDTAGVPDKALAKNDGDADVGKKGKGKTPDEHLSGAGAQQKDVQTYKGEDAVMQAISALAKSVQEGLAGVTQKVEAMDKRVDGVAALAKKTDAALNGTVFGEAGEDQVGTVRKADADAPPLLDTAYSRRTA